MKAKKVYEAMDDVIPGKKEMMGEYKKSYQYWLHKFKAIIKSELKEPKHYMDDDISWDEYLEYYADEWEEQYYDNGLTPQEAANEFIEWVGNPAY
jgi:hypothetical protein